MSRAKSISDELKRIDTIVEKQVALNMNPELVEKNTQAFCNAIAVKLNNMKGLGAEDDAVLYDAVNACRSFSDAQKKKTSSAWRSPTSV